MLAYLQSPRRSNLPFSMRADELDFHLPPELIAQHPTAERAASRLLHYRRDDRSIAHRHFADLSHILRPGDLLVFNDARVVPARFNLRKATGGRVEALYLGQTPSGHWNVLLRSVGKAAPGTKFTLEAEPAVAVTLVRSGEAGEHEIVVHADEPALVLLERIGRMPLPPYIKREKDHDARDASDRERYQTVYARVPGSVAAPTAGLHFTDELLASLGRMGVHRAAVTLHVGLGTFKPVTADELDAHPMHRESYEISAPTAEAINLAKAEGRRVVAVGTTSARVLESQPEGILSPVAGDTALFIRPPYRFNHVDAMITNFHLPRSTLIALVAGLVGLDEQRRIYAEAIAERYRFFSYGDAMIVE